MTENYDKESLNLIKICRHCHKIIKNIERKCDNGCYFEAPYFLQNKKNTNIEDGEILLKSNKKDEIRWMCIACNTQYSSEEINGKKFVCTKCKTINDLYPFTSKTCINCKEKDGNNHKLNLNANFCDICGKTQFILNENKSTLTFKKKNPDYKNDEKGNISGSNNISIPWDGLEIFEFENIDNIENKTIGNGPKLTITIKNCNFEMVLFSEEKSISLYDIIKSSPGYIPESIYNRYIQKIDNNEKEFIHIYYDSQVEQYTISGNVVFDYSELDMQYFPVNEIKKLEIGQKLELPRRKLLQIYDDFWKIHIWIR